MDTWPALLLAAGCSIRWLVALPYMRRSQLLADGRTRVSWGQMAEVGERRGAVAGAARLFRRIGELPRAATPAADGRTWLPCGPPGGGWGWRWPVIAVRRNCSGTPTPVSCLASSTRATDSLLCYMGIGVPPQVFDEKPQLSLSEDFFLVACSCAGYVESMNNDVGIV